MATDPEKPEPQEPQRIDTSTIGPWLSTPVTITTQRWVLVAAGLAAVILLLVALD